MGVQNFFVIHKSGKIFSSQNFQGTPLDNSLVIGFSSSVSNFCQILMGEDIKEVVSQKGRVIYKQVGDFIFLVHADIQTGTAVVQSILRDVVAMCEFLFGSHQHWDEDFFDLKGAQDMISMYFPRLIQDPEMAVNGISRVILDNDIYERLDKLLAYLECQDGICGNGTMLILGNSALFSRFEHKETRMILQYNKARPLGTLAVRYTPVYSGGAWHNLYMIHLQNYVLAVMTFIDKSYADIEKKLEEFKLSFLQSRLEIPSEEPPILLRLFAKRETLAMLYHNIKTGCTVFPQLRPGPDVQQKDIMHSFWNFFCEASGNMKIPGITEFSISRDQHKFYARSEGVHLLYVLYAAESVGSNSVAQISSEILKNIKAYIKSN